MTEWKLTGESNYAPVNAFPARNLRKGARLGGNWIVAFNDGQHPRKLLNTPELTPRAEKILDLKGLRGHHGNTSVKFITNAKLAGQKYTSIKSSGWTDLKLFSLDLTENLLNLQDIEVISENLELLELAFNEIHKVKILKVASFSTLQYLDLSWNYLKGDSVTVVGKLTGLKMLNLSSNRINEFELDDDDFPNLLHLKMISNKLKSSCFHQLKKIECLQELFLNDNQIKQIPLLGDGQSHIALSNLRLLDLSDNPISEETKLVPAASFPSLEKLFIVRTNIARNTKGDPPLLKEYLKNRIGIELKRSDESKLPHKNCIFMQNSVKIDDKVPKVVRSTIDERIKSYRAELALEHKAQEALEAGENAAQIADEIVEKVVEPEFSDTFFITQEMTDEKLSFQHELEKMTNQIKENVKQEFPLPETSLVQLLEFSAEEQEEYDNSVKSIPLQAAINQLRRLLTHDGPKVHKSRAHRLTVQDNPDPYKPRKFNYNTMAMTNIKETPEKTAMRTNLAHLRDRQMLAIDKVDDLLESSNTADRKEADELFGQIKDTFLTVRQNSIEHAQRYRNGQKDGKKIQTT